MLYQLGNCYFSIIPASTCGILSEFYSFIVLIYLYFKFYFYYYKIYSLKKRSRGKDSLGYKFGLFYCFEMFGDYKSHLSIDITDKTP